MFENQLSNFAIRLNRTNFITIYTSNRTNPQSFNKPIRINITYFASKIKKSMQSEQDLKQKLVPTGDGLIHRLVILAIIVALLLAITIMVCLVKAAFIK